MNADELMKRAIEYGADEAGIQDRFGGNAELYELCFREFLEIPAHATLKAAIDEGDAEDAFTAAHALKGLSGNLGLTGYFNAISTLTESLRAKRIDAAPAEYAEVRRQYQALDAMYRGGFSAPKAGKPSQRVKKVSDKLVAVIFVLLLAIAALVFIMFGQMTASYAQGGFYINEIQALRQISPICPI